MFVVQIQTIIWPGKSHYSPIQLVITYNMCPVCFYIISGCGSIKVRRHSPVHPQVMYYQGEGIITTLSGKKSREQKTKTGTKDDDALINDCSGFTYLEKCPGFATLKSMVITEFFSFFLRVLENYSPCQNGLWTIKFFANFLLVSHIDLDRSIQQTNESLI